MSHLIDLIRHGQPVGGSMYRGHNIDDPLSEKGWQQMWKAVDDKAPWDHVISSPLIRCKAFAEALCEKHNLPLSVETDLEEVGFGGWEGKTPKEIIETHPYDHDAFYRDPVNNRPHGAEDLDVFYDRVSAVYRKVTSVYEGNHLLVVAHAGVIRAIVACVLNAPAASMYRMKIDNAGLVRIEITSIGPNLIYYNQPKLKV